ncbi:MAG: hypothetical protein R2773_04785, partial [Flavobacteriaceae bacterium]
RINNNNWALLCHSERSEGSLKQRQRDSLAPSLNHSTGVILYARSNSGLDPQSPTPQVLTSQLTVPKAFQVRVKYVLTVWILYG